MPGGATLAVSAAPEDLAAMTASIKENLSRLSDLVNMIYLLTAGSVCKA